MIIEKKWNEVLGELLEELNQVADEFGVPVEYSRIEEKDHSFDEWGVEHKINESIFNTVVRMYSDLAEYHSVEVRETAYSSGKISVLTNMEIKFRGNGYGEISL